MILEQLDKHPAERRCERLPESVRSTVGSSTCMIILLSGRIRQAGSVENVRAGAMRRSIECSLMAWNPDWRWSSSPTYELEG